MTASYSIPDFAVCLIISPTDFPSGKAISPYPIFSVSKPLSIYVDLFANDEEKNMHVENLIKENFDLSPRGIREMLGLNKPIYQKTAAYGHFGREPESDGSFSWEKTDKSGVFK